jgi:hypothetical protein
MGMENFVQKARLFLILKLFFFELLLSVCSICGAISILLNT